MVWHEADGGMRGQPAVACLFEFVAQMKGAACAAGVDCCIHASPQCVQFFVDKFCGFERKFCLALPGGNDHFIMERNELRIRMGEDS